MKLFWRVIGVSLAAATTVYAEQKLPLRITVEKNTQYKDNVLHQAKTVDHGALTYHYPRVTATAQQVSLDIKILNMGATEAKGVEIRYVVFSRGFDQGGVQIVTQGSRTLDFKPLQTQVVQTKPAKFQKQDARYTTGVGPQNNKHEGAEYGGVAVAAYNNNQRVAVFYEPQDLEQSIRRLANPDIFNISPPPAAPPAARKKKGKINSTDSTQ